MKHLRAVGRITLLCGAVVGAFVVNGGNGPPDDFARAVELSRSDPAAAIAALRSALRAEPAACQRAIVEPAFASGLRDRSEFRSAVHDAAVQHGISRLSLAPEDEPGEWIEIDGQTVDEQGRPVAGAIVRVFATDAAGRYHPTIEGERLPRLFATLVADQEGRFGFRTVRPGPYPGTRNARHIHVSAKAGSLRLARPNYAVFDDDPLLQEPQNAEQRGEAIRILMREDRGRLTLPLR